MRNEPPFLFFPIFSYLARTQLKNNSRNLGHPSVENQMRLIEDAAMEELPSDLRQKNQGDCGTLPFLPVEVRASSSILVFDS